MLQILCRSKIWDYRLLSHAGKSHSPRPLLNLPTHTPSPGLIVLSVPNRCSLLRPRQKCSMMWKISSGFSILPSSGCDKESNVHVLTINSLLLGEKMFHLDNVLAFREAHKDSDYAAEIAEGCKQHFGNTASCKHEVVDGNSLHYP